uniref:Uncharacterized protein n=1 Tax=Proboscia inermis TaxID=420281 RepID=A0A7S0C3M4_9STRA
MGIFSCPSKRYICFWLFLEISLKIYSPSIHHHNDVVAKNKKKKNKKNRCGGGKTTTTTSATRTHLDHNLFSLPFPTFRFFLFASFSFRFLFSSSIVGLHPFVVKNFG